MLRGIRAEEGYLGLGLGLGLGLCSEVSGLKRGTYTAILLSVTDPYTVRIRIRIRVRIL